MHPSTKSKNEMLKKLQILAKRSLQFAYILNGPHANDMQNLSTSPLMQLAKTIQDINLNNVTGHKCFLQT
jgi:hypothetical protein